MAADVLSPAVFRGAGCQTGYPCVKLQGGLQFTGHQKSKGSSYRVDVYVQVDLKKIAIQSLGATHMHCCAVECHIRSTLFCSTLTLRTASSVAT